MLRTPPTFTLFPYTTLFRSAIVGDGLASQRQPVPPRSSSFRLGWLQFDRHLIDLGRSEEHTSELQSRLHLVCRLLLEKKNKTTTRQRSQLPFALHIEQPPPA